MRQLTMGWTQEAMLTDDDLDRYYTPDPLARMIVRMLAETGFVPRTVIEPSVGGGAFVRAVRQAWPEAVIWGCDVDRKARGLALCDERFVGDFTAPGSALAQAAYEAPPPVLVIGNPPFSDDVAVEHVQVALGLRPDCLTLILPLAYLGVQRWEPLLWDRPLPSPQLGPAKHRPALSVVGPIRPRPWTRVREVAQYTWTRQQPDRVPAEAVLRPLPRWR